MDSLERSDLLNRRDLIKVTGSTALAIALAELLRDSSLLVRAVRAQDAPAGVDVPDTTVHLASTDPSQPGGQSYATIKAKIREALQATRDLNVIKSGDLCVIKVVSNSPYPYPMTTNPQALQAVIEIVKEHTQNVRVVDQVGFEHDLFSGDTDLSKTIQALWKQFPPSLLISTQKQVSSGMDALKQNGLLAVAQSAGAQVFSGDHDADYLQVPNDNPIYGSSSDPEFAAWTPWTDINQQQRPVGFRVNKYALGFSDDGSGNLKAPDKPPHMISISRISAHIWAGTTGPIKAYYGWIHPADRLHSHLDISNNTTDPLILTPGQPLDLPHPQVNNQGERITEVAAWFQKFFSRLKGTTYYANLVVALDTYSDIGPDWGNVPLPGGKPVAPGSAGAPTKKPSGAGDQATGTDGNTYSSPDGVNWALPGPGIIAASQDVVSLDALASDKLLDAMRNTPESVRTAPEKKEASRFWDFITNHDKYENATQALTYTATRGWWNSTFGSQSFLEQIDNGNKSPSVWNLDQISAGLGLGLGKNTTIDYLDSGANLTKSQLSLMQNEPGSSKPNLGIDDAVNSVNDKQNDRKTTTQPGDK